MKITILNRGLKIPAYEYGGTERVIWGLGYELSKLGHEVTFVVPNGSSCSFGKIIPYNSDEEIEGLLPKDSDFAHYNFVPKKKPDCSFLVTHHGNFMGEKCFPLNTVFVSENHAKRHGAEAFVHNGLLWEEYEEIDLNKNRTYFHFLGKASWKVKNVAGAAETAVKAKQKLKVLGGNRWKLSMLKRTPYYLLHPNLEFLGMVDDKTKMKVMQESKGLIFPILWDEPFGLAIIESLYAGCPVFGTKKGSLPELINEEVGFLSDSIDKLSKALNEYQFNPEICHLYAKENFNSKKMTEKYLYYYNEILKGRDINSQIPKNI